MVAQWGFTASRSADPDFMLAWEASNAGPFSQRTMSPDTELKIDQCTKDIVDGAYALCKATLSRHRRLLDALASELVEKETVTHAELLELLERNDPGLLHTVANGSRAPSATPAGL
jgi:ATP-dependent Zn protease